MKKLYSIIGLVSMLLLFGCASSGTQTHLSTANNSVKNPSTLIKVTQQQVNIIKNVQNLPKAVQ